MVEGPLCFAIQLWWESLPWLIEVETKPCSNKLEIREGVKGLLCTGGRVRKDEELFIRVVEDLSLKECGSFASSVHNHF